MSSTDAWAHADRLKKQKRVKSNKRLLGPIEGVIFDEMNERNAHRDTEHCHPSDLAKGDWCPRQTFYKMTDHAESNPETMTLRKMNIFAEGHNIHAKWQEWLRRAGILWGDWKCRFCGHKWGNALSPSHCPICYQGPPEYAEVGLKDEKHHIIGHTDGWIKDKEGDCLLEIKSVGLGTIRWDAPQLYSAYEDGRIGLDELWKRIKRPLAAHNRQVQLYMYILGLDRAVVIYEWKPTQEVREFHVELDMDIVQPMLDGALMVKEAVDAGEAPPRPEGADIDSRMCKWCPFKDDCYEH